MCENCQSSPKKISTWASAAFVESRVMLSGADSWKRFHKEIVPLGRVAETYRIKQV
jgi:hypothetical protein